MTVDDSASERPGLEALPGERGFVLTGAGAQEQAERLFGARLTVGQASRLPWEAGAPTLLVVPVAADHVEVRIRDQEPWVSRLRARLDGQAASGFGAQLARVISRVEAWRESEAEGATSPEELAAELSRLRQLAPSAGAEQAIVDALDALDDGLPADAVVAALYRAGAGSR